MRATLTREFELSASHRLWREEWTAEQNAAAFGKCTRWHGHNYRVEVAVTGEVDVATGMVYDLAALKAAIESAVVAVLDHRCLNDILAEPSTVENVAAWVHQRLQRAIGSDRHALKVRVWETPKNSAIYPSE